MNDQDDHVSPVKLAKKKPDPTCVTCGHSPLKSAKKTRKVKKTRIELSFSVKATRPKSRLRTVEQPFTNEQAISSSGMGIEKVTKKKKTKKVKKKASNTTATSENGLELVQQQQNQQTPKIIAESVQEATSSPAIEKLSTSRRSTRISNIMTANLNKTNENESSILTNDKENEDDTANLTKDIMNATFDKSSNLVIAQDVRGVSN